MMPDGTSLPHKNRNPDSNNTLRKSRADKGCLRVPGIPRAPSTCPPTPLTSRGVPKGAHQISSNVLDGDTDTCPRPHPAPRNPAQDQLTGRAPGGYRRAGAQGEEGFGTPGWGFFRRPGPAPRDLPATYEAPGGPGTHTL